MNGINIIQIIQALLGIGAIVGVYVALDRKVAINRERMSNMKEAQQKMEVGFEKAVEKVEKKLDEILIAVKTESVKIQDLRLDLERYSAEVKGLKRAYIKQNEA